MKSEYTVLRDGWLAGRRVKAGDKIVLTPAQAQYEPADMIAPVEAAEVAQAAEAISTGAIQPPRRKAVPAPSEGS